MEKAKASVAKNAVYQTIYNVLATITPLITTPIISRELGPEKLGVFSYTLTVSNYFTIFAMLGVVNYGTRSIADATDYSEVSKRFWCIYAIQGFMSVVCIALYLLYVMLFVPANTIIFVVQTFWILSALFDVNWFFFGLEEFKITVTRNIIIKFLTVISIVLFVRKGHNPLLVYTLIMAGGNFISVISILPLLKSRLIWYKPEWSDIKKHIKPIFVLFIPLLSGVLFGSMDKLMLGSMSEYEQLGYYYNADRIINIPLTVISGVSTVLFPRISAMISQDKREESLVFISRSYDIVIWMAVLLSFGIAGCAKEFVSVFFGSGYEKCVPIIYIMTPLLLINAVCMFYRMQYLVPFHHDKLYAWALFIGTVVNLSLNFPLIFAYKALGAAVATLVAQIVVMIIQFKRHEGVDIRHWLFILVKYVILGFCMFIVMRWLSKIIDNTMSALMIEVLVGGLSYFLLSLLYWKIAGGLNDKISLIRK